MYISYLRLKNYIGIKNGLHKQEVEINFNTKRQITLFLGANGSGKSTIVHSLHPFSFGEDDKPNIIIKGLDGEKEIHYVHNNKHYKIIHQYSASKTGHNVKSYISKKDIDSGTWQELNPNGNVSTFIIEVEKELEITPLYLKLSKLAINSNNIVNMTSGERKKYFNDIQPTLDTINGFYKTLTEKVKVIKQLLAKVSHNIDQSKDQEELNNRLNTISNELNNYDNITTEVRMTEMKLKTQYDNHKNELFKVGIDIKDMDNVSEILDEYMNKFNTVKNNIQYLANKLLMIGKIYNIEDLDKINEVMYSKKTEAEMLEQKINENSSKLGEINGVLNEKIALLEEKSAKKNNIISNSEYKTLLETRELYNKNLKEYDKKLSIRDMSKFIGISSNDVKRAQVFLGELSQYITTFLQSYTVDIIEYAVDNYNKNTNQEYFLQTTKLQEIMNNKTELRTKQTRAEEDFERKSKLQSQRPKDCKIDDCPFIKMIKDNPVTDKEIEEREKKIISLEKDIKKCNDDIEFLKEVMDVKRNLEKISTWLDTNINILLKLGISDRITNKDKLFQWIRTGNCTIPWDLEELIEYISIRELRDDLILKEKELNLKIENYDMQIQYTDELEKDIQKLSTEVNNARHQYKFLLDDNYNKNLQKDELAKDISTLYDATVKISEFKNYKEELNVLTNKIKVLEDFNIFKLDMDKSIEKNKRILINIGDSSDKLNQEKEDIIFNIKKLDEYKREKELLENDYNKLLLLKDVASPNKGIPLIFIDIYMRRARTLANKLLQEILTDEYELLPFNINEKEFNIPCKKLNGIINEDVRTMSMGEKAIIALILSVSLFAQGSNGYNIITIDEMDGPLDFENKQKFLGVLEKIMSIFDMEQVFVISHNNAFENYETNFVLLNGSPEIKNKNSDYVLYNNNNF